MAAEDGFLDSKSRIGTGIFSVGFANCRQLRLQDVPPSILPSLGQKTLNRLVFGSSLWNHYESAPSLVAVPSILNVRQRYAFRLHPKISRSRVPHHLL